MFQQFIVLAQSVFWYATKLLSQPEYRRKFLMNSFVRDTNLYRLAVLWFNKMQHSYTRTYTPNTQRMIDAQSVVDNFSTILKNKRRLLLLPAMCGYG